MSDCIGYKQGHILSIRKLKLTLFIGFLGCILGLVFYSVPSQANSRVCSGIFKSEVVSNSQNSTMIFFSYIKNLLEERVLIREDILKFREGLAIGEIPNPIPFEKSSFGIFFTQSSFQIHYESLQKYLDQKNIDQNLLLKLIEKLLREKDKEQKKRTKTREESVFAFHKLEFHRIEPGDFVMGDEKKQVPVTISKPFEMSSTPVTNVMWIALKRHMKKGDYGNVNYLDADFPVSNVSWYDVEKFINELNELSNVEDQKIQSDIRVVIPSHKKGDKYRLPTSAEWEFVVRGRGQFKERFYFGESDQDIDEHSWHAMNSKGKAQPVAQLKPLQFESKYFYDMYGNIFEWVLDAHSEELIGGIDPLIPPSSNKSWRVLRGGSHRSMPKDIGSGIRGMWNPDMRDDFIGFRLVKEVVLGEEK